MHSTEENDTWFVGDVQGCAEPLERLERALPGVESRRRLVFVGDLVNRGPDSLGALRHVRSLVERGRGATVLGNHDLHLLACRAGLRRPKGRDTLGPILAAPDVEPLIRWLRHQPLARREEGWLVVHAGLFPGWSVEDALAVSDAASERLACDTRWIPFLERVVAQRGSVEPDDAEDALAYRVGVLTRIRCVDRATGALAPSYTGPYETIPPSMQAWFDAFGPGGVKASASCDATVRVVHGHWAALGCRRTATGWAVDDGCVWGQALAALRARDEHVVRVPDRNPDVA